jgi:hypothetical protein
MAFSIIPWLGSGPTKWDVAQALLYTDLIAAACANLAKTAHQAQSCDHIRRAIAVAALGIISCISEQHAMALPSSESSMNGWMQRAICEGQMSCLISDF